MIEVGKKKPKVVDLTRTACDWSPSKDYLWRYVGWLLEKKFNKNEIDDTPLIADCACQAALTRHIFPKKIDYVGFDIEILRLQSAIKKYPKDRFVLSDLCAPVNEILIGGFDCVVSLNTLSHMNAVMQKKALRNMIDMTSETGTLIVNTNTGKEANEAMKILNSKYENIEIVYTDAITYEQSHFQPGKKIKDIDTLLCEKR